MGDFLNHIGGAIGGILSGGLTGIVGAGLQRFADYENKKLDLQLNLQQNAHEVEMKKADAEIMANEWASRTKVAEIESMGRSDVAESQAFSASFNEPAQYSLGVSPNERQGWALVLLDFIRGIVRPGLTIYLCALTTAIYFNARHLMASAVLDSAQAIAIMNQIVNTILYLTTTCLLWWFGVRNHQKAPRI